MLNIAPLDTPAIQGIQIAGLAAEDLDSPETRRRLVELWVQHGLIVFRDLYGPELQLKLSEVFGPCIEHPGKQIDQGRDFPQLVDINFLPERSDIYEVEGRKLGGWLPWHMDTIYVAEVNHGGILTELGETTSGGITGFMDKVTLYDALPEPLKARIAGREVIYRYDLDMARQRFGKRPGQRVVRWSPRRAEMQSRIDQGHYPPVVHPLTFVQPETGRTLLNLSPWFAERIVGMSFAESDRLLSEIVDHHMDEAKAYFHSWRPGDMVLWDNWRMIHNASGVSTDVTRLARRSTIAGDYALGRVATAEDLACADDDARVCPA